ncbi:MAG TPA: HEAT repeat domain-containing protein [Tepidisphaeraceae bacterium]|jgi:hypothetical protein|nr:HEAT repeat domain-containing protein [Tepidisphaeraceae bacterium]
MNTPGDGIPRPVGRPVPSVPVSGARLPSTPPIVRQQPMAYSVPPVPQRPAGPAPTAEQYARAVVLPPANIGIPGTGWTLIGSIVFVIVAMIGMVAFNVMRHTVAAVHHATATPAQLAIEESSPENILAMLHSPDHFKCMSAIDKLHHADTQARLADPRTPASVRQGVHDAICNMAGSGDRSSRLDGTRVLGQIGTDADIPLLATLANETGELRNLAPIAGAGAMRINPQRGLKIVETHWADRGWVDGVGYELRDFGDKAEPLALLMLQSKHPSLRHTALIALREFGTPAAMEPLEKARAIETDEDCRKWYQYTEGSINERAAKKK